VRLSRPVLTILRSGCYVTHDSGNYERLLAGVKARSGGEWQARPGLQPALEVWARVQSCPEPGLAILTMGKRDASYDIEMPIPLKRFRAGADALPRPVPAGWKIAAMNDQHAYLRFAADEADPPQVGDLVGCGISHPVHHLRQVARAVHRRRRLSRHRRDPHLLLIGAAMPSRTGAEPPALLLRGGTVIDGTGAPRFRADVRIEGERIVAIGAGLPVQGAEVIDAGGKIVAPGFIDVHTHDDQIVLAAPQMLPKVSQGVTTVVVGNCGISLAPLARASVPPPLNLLGGGDAYVHATMAAYVEAVNAARPAVNVAALVGHSTLRVATMDDPYRAATPAEQARMVELLREGLGAGAAGLSSGVFYATGAAADVEELALLAGEAGAAGGVYTTHIRQEMDKVLDSLDEAFATARRGRVPLVVSHHKCAGPANWGRTVQTLAHIDAARRDQAIGLDCYPYIAGSTVLRTDLVDGVIDILVTWSEPHPEMTARSLASIAAEWGCSQVEACERLQPGGACYFQMREDDVQRVLRYPATMIGSDGLPHDQHPHPRLWGTFPRVLGHYSRDSGALFRSRRRCTR
jgi:N-acyl-D-amino-acid deacylase